MSDALTAVVFVTAIVLSLAGGGMVGYFLGRTSNGHGRDIDELQGHVASMRDELDHLRADVASIQSAIMKSGDVA